MAAPFPSPRHFSLVFLGFVGCRRVALWLRSSVCQDMTSSLSKLCFLLQAVLWVGFWLSSSFGKNNSTTFKKSLKITACYKIPPKKWYHVAGNEVESGGGWGLLPRYLLGKGSVRQGWGDWLQAELPAGSFSPAETDQAPDLLGPALLPPWGNPAPSTSPLPGAWTAASHLDAW